MRGRGIIAAINTCNSKQIIPDGNYILREGDNVLVGVGCGSAKFIHKLFVTGSK